MFCYLLLQIDFEFDLLLGGPGTTNSYEDVEDRFSDLVMDVTEKKGIIMIQTNIYI